MSRRRGRTQSRSPKNLNMCAALRGRSRASPEVNECDDRDHRHHHLRNRRQVEHAIVSRVDRISDALARGARLRGSIDRGLWSCDDRVTHRAKGGALTTLARIGVALLAIYGLGWVGLGLYVAIGAGTVGGAMFFIVVAAICAGLAVLGSRHPLAAGAVLLVPVTFPLGLALAGLSDVSGWAAISALLWFAAAPFLIGVVFLVAGLVAARKRHRNRIAEMGTRPSLPDDRHQPFVEKSS